MNREINHFVQYHKTEERGFHLSEISDLRAYTNKELNESEMIGAYVWLVGGEGKPRKYKLGYVFEV